MAIATPEKTVQIHLTLSEEEARWLAAYTQNPMYSTYPASPEMPEEQAKRCSIFEALTKALRDA